MKQSLGRFAQFLDWLKSPQPNQLPSLPYLSLHSISYSYNGGRILCIKISRQNCSRRSCPLSLSSFVALPPLTPELALSTDWCIRWNRCRNCKLPSMDTRYSLLSLPPTSIKAILFARTGANLILTARRQEHLDKVAELAKEAHLEGKTGKGGKFVTLTLDVSDKSAVKGLLERIPQELRDIDILVNNVRLPSLSQSQAG